MKNLKICSLLALLSLAVATHLAAQGTAFTYQGRLADGGSKANGNYDLTFTLFDASTDGDVIAGPLTNTAVAVSNGLFITTIDFGAGVFTGQPYWLEISVATNASGNFETLDPRQQVTPVPYSIYSSDSAHAALADVASGISSGVVSAPQLNTVGTPGTGQVLGYNGSQLVWQDPVIGGNSGGWALNGNAGTTPGINYVGTSDNEPLFLDVGGSPALQLEPDATGAGAPNFIGGSPANFVASGVSGATIAGGGAVNYFGTAYSNTVTASFGAIGGGARNIAGGQESFVGGGYQNNAAGYICSVLGGAYNIADGDEAVVGGGAYNNSTNFAFIGGGYANVASGFGSVIGGGGYDGSSAQVNTANGPVSFIGGGLENSAGGYAAALPGGMGNNASGLCAAVGGGLLNISSGSDTYGYTFDGFPRSVKGSSTVCGGDGNTASAAGATVPGGAANVASADLSFAAGFHANADTAGSFVWADISSPAQFSSSTANQFLIRASGGVGIGTTVTPPGGLIVATGGLAVSGASSPNYGTASGVFVEKVGTTAGAVYAYNYQTGTPLPLALNSPGGNVGIGTTTPAYTLDVNGTTRTHSIIITGGSDLAEPFRMGREEIPQGAVVVIDEANPGQLKMSRAAYDSHVAGIVSGANGVHPGIALQQEGVLDGGQNVALSGRVYVLADASHGAINPGDLLTTSDLPGRAMKVTDHTRASGAILGKAMTGLSQGQGMVLVLVSLQ